MVAQPQHPHATRLRLTVRAVLRAAAASVFVETVAGLEAVAGFAMVLAE